MATDWAKLAKERAAAALEQARTPAPEVPARAPVEPVPPGALQAIDRALGSVTPAMSAAADPEWEALVAWFRTAKLPTEPYRLDQARVVDGPEASHAWLRARIAEGPRGQVRESIRARLKLLRQLFGDNRGQEEA